MKINLGVIPTPASLPILIIHLTMPPTPPSSPPHDRHRNRHRANYLVWGCVAQMLNHGAPEPRTSVDGVRGTARV